MGWIEDQASLQNTVGNSVPMSGAELSEYVRWNALALIKEVGEVLDHVSWKPWTVDEDWIERDEYIAELTDVALFLGNMLAAVGCSTEWFMSRIAHKQAIVKGRLLSERYEQRRITQ